MNGEKSMKGGGIGFERWGKDLKGAEKERVVNILKKRQKLAKAVAVILGFF